MSKSKLPINCWVQIISHTDYKTYLNLWNVPTFTLMLACPKFKRKLLYIKYGISNPYKFPLLIYEVERAIRHNIHYYRYFCNKYLCCLDNHRQNLIQEYNSGVHGLILNNVDKFLNDSIIDNELIINNNKLHKRFQLILN